ncbi:hypothetical protein BXZ70DRAFT_1006291 [Cristinia sonorae]|uniref:Uncharacterized protein n=1 Tax=Cristinia sonorae TaxID=1940300 RepID=A0A8K0XS38_9AGAR|nr:hypothetical protein BXZ70DRAFT_1006291 [Cristinia sonorae]
MEPHPTALQGSLPPHVENVRYAIAAAAGAWVWDLLSSLPDMICLANNSPPDIVHFANRRDSSRIIHFLVTGIDHCEALAKAVGWLGAITISAQNVPFFFCARSVLYPNRFAVTALLLLLLLCTGSSLVSPFFIRAESPGEGRTPSCTLIVEEGWAAGILAAAVWTSTTFILVNLQLTMFSHGESESSLDRIKVFMHRRKIGETAKLIMRSGQMYILPSIFANIAATIVAFIPPVPSPHKLLVVVLSIVIQSCMISRIHWKIRQGLIDPPPPEVPSTVRFRRHSESAWSHNDGRKASTTFQVGDGNLVSTVTRPACADGTDIKREPIVVYSLT